MHRSAVPTFVVFAMLACSPKAAPVDAGPTAEELKAQQVDRGRYLVNSLGACAFCHTPLNADGSRDTTRAFAGVDCLIDIDPADPAAGCISPRN